MSMSTTTRAFRFDGGHHDGATLHVEDGVRLVSLAVTLPQIAGSVILGTQGYASYRLCPGCSQHFVYEGFYDEPRGRLLEVIVPSQPYRYN